MTITCQTQTLRVNGTRGLLHKCNIQWTGGQGEGKGERCEGGVGGEEGDRVGDGGKNRECNRGV